MSSGDVGGSGLVAERLLQVIDEGQRTATYKLALVLALIDALAEAASADGSPPDVLHTRQVATHVVRIYYPQVRPYVGSGARGREAEVRATDDGDRARQPGVLRQISNNRSVTITAVLKLHLVAGASSLNQAALAHPTEYTRCLDTVEENFARYPIRLLQVVGRSDLPFLYDVDWGPSVSLKALHGPGGGLLRFRPGVAPELLRLAPLIRPLVELHWTREVARWNDLDLEGEQLRTHLFGTERVAVPKALRGHLVDLQDGACFYCGARLAGPTEIDHFVPWSRWPNDAIENLVAADRRCNNDKRDRLAASQHVDHWAGRLERVGGDLAEVARSMGWETSIRRTVSLARTGYHWIPVGTPLWFGVDSLVEEGLGPIRQRLATIAP